MYFRNLILGSAALVPLLGARPALAQRVQADIRIGGGPISGRVIIGDRYRYRPREAYIPVRRVYVERVRFRDRGRREGWFKKFRRSARVVVFYDRRDDCFYDRYRPGYREIEVFERDGRYYWPDEDRYYDDRYDSRYDGRYDSRYDPRYDPRYDGRNDDRYDDRYDGRRDGRDDGRNDDRNRRDRRDNRNY
jgi:hypothetical protein